MNGAGRRTSFLPVKIWRCYELLVLGGMENGRTYIDGDQVNLGVTVLARLGGGHVDDLARAAWKTVGIASGMH